MSRPLPSSLQACLQLRERRRQAASLYLFELDEILEPEWVLDQANVLQIDGGQMGHSRLISVSHGTLHCGAVRTDLRYGAFAGGRP
jgi:hypothetical protein